MPISLKLQVVGIPELDENDEIRDRLKGETDEQEDVMAKRLLAGGSRFSHRSVVGRNGKPSKVHSR